MTSKAKMHSQVVSSKVMVFHYEEWDASFPEAMAKLQILSALAMVH